jgi:stage II sporulation protein AA (anti-sigma F factor antagonist)
VTDLTNARLEVQSQSDTLNIKINGDIDHHSVKKIREEIDKRINSFMPLCVYLDLGSVDFMDSSGLGLILGRYALVKDIGGRLVLTNPSRRIKKILTLAGIERIIEIEGDDKNEAC